MNYRDHYSSRNVSTSQAEAIPGKEHLMAKNAAGGYTFKIDDKKRLERFLVLGTEGGTYYVSEKKLTKESAQAVARCLQSDGLGTIKTVVEISKSGRAHKNDPALFVLAMASASPNLDVRRAALAALPEVARTGTHLMHFAEYVEGFRGWGRSLRKAVGGWYLNQDLDNLALQLIKYQSRDGWSNRDLLKLSHPDASNDVARNTMFKWVVDGYDSLGSSAVELHPKIAAFEMAKKAGSSKEIIKLINDYDLPREAIPTEYLNDSSVWDALLHAGKYGMPMTAMIRNLGKMSSVGLLTTGSDASKFVVNKLQDKQALKYARVHPLTILAALTTYAQGRGVRGSNTWTVVQRVADALDSAFYNTFDNVEPTGKSFLLAVDVSGSMSGGSVSGIVGLTPNKAAAAMALVTANVESDHTLIGFTSTIKELKISPKMRLDQVAQIMQHHNFGSTDCSAAINWALANKVNADVFSIYTDNETWCGRNHPTQALNSYRTKVNPKAKLVTVGMAVNDFSIADPTDAGQLDVVGFDTSTPSVIADFARE